MVGAVRATGAVGNFAPRARWGKMMRAPFKIAVLAILALGLAGCDKCGHWFTQTTPKSCSGEAPR